MKTSTTGCWMIVLVSSFILHPISFSDTHYVAPGGGNSAPYTNWATAALDIQTAVDAAIAGDTVLVSNGTYNLSAGITVNNAITVESVNGPDVTIVDGQSTHRCFHLAYHAATLRGFTIQNGEGGVVGGGGVYCNNATPIIERCIFTGNNAQWGGGCYYGTLENCLLYDNTAGSGGGCIYSTLKNCTITTNHAEYGGGNSFGTLLNTIAYGNIATDSESPNDLWGATATHSCSPSLSSGSGNITANPQFVDALGSNFRLQASSPCIDIGSNQFGLAATDLDGNARIFNTTIDMGAYESQLPLLSITNAPPWVNIDATNAIIQGTAAGVTGHIRWSNELNAASGMIAAGSPWGIDVPLGEGVNPVTVSASNAFGTVSDNTTIYGQYAASWPTHYAAPGGGNVWPYTTWATAANAIQDAVDAATSGDTVWVSNGVYNTGGAVTPGYACNNRVLITNNITIQSVNGPEVTSILGAEATGGGLGADAVRGVYMTKGFLSGFTIANGHTMTSGDPTRDRMGGGANLHTGNGLISNCTFTGNSAYFGGGVRGGTLYNCRVTDNTTVSGSGGGVAFSTLNHCILSDNTSGVGGGGADGGTLNYCMVINNTSVSLGGGAWSTDMNNCTVAGNSAGGDGGGCSGGTLYNCTIVGNTAASRGGGTYSGTQINCIIYDNVGGTSNNTYFGSQSHCCIPGRTDSGNISGPPLFADAAFRLLAVSPCVDAGTTIPSITDDLDGTPRPLDGNGNSVTNWDIGAYEFASTLADADGDGLSDSDEVYVHGSDPKDADSDGDGRDDGDEAAMGWSPTFDESAVHSDLDLLGLYNSNSIHNLSLGHVMLHGSNGMMHLDLQLQQSETVTGVWTEVGAPVPWSEPMDAGKEFFRVIGD